VDTTGLESGHVSRHYLKAAAGRCKRYRPFLKVGTVCDVDTHLIAALVTAVGPTNDASHFEPLARAAARTLRPAALVGDAAFDCEAFHRLCRECLGIRRTAFPVNHRGFADRVPTTRYRREMAERFPARRYAQRAQAESVYSRLKRRLGSELRARSAQGRHWEARVRVLTHNLMILKRSA
jgi:hypothetical protein